MEQVESQNKKSGFWFGSCLAWLTALVMLTLVIYFAYSQLFQNPCKLPVKYTIGNVDSRFKINEPDVKTVVEEAVTRWNAATGETVLSYDPTAPLKINLVYDEKQANLDKVTADIGALDVSGNAVDALRSKIEKQISQYQTDLQAYNDQIDYWNANGGAPPDIYVQLQKTKSALDQRRVTINSSAELLNKQIDQQNSNLDNVNNEILSDKNKIVTQGTYFPSDPKIDIYTFGNKDELRLVMMHELGHALSLGHDNIEQSIMFPILANQNLADPKPSDEDLQMFTKVCKSKEGAWENVKQKFQVLKNQILNRQADPEQSN